MAKFITMEKLKIKNQTWQRAKKAKAGKQRCIAEIAGAALASKISSALEL